MCFSLRFLPFLTFLKPTQQIELKNPEKTLRLPFCMLSRGHLSCFRFMIDIKWIFLTLRIWITINSAIAKWKFTMQYYHHFFSPKQFQRSNGDNYQTFPYALVHINFRGELSFFSVFSHTHKDMCAGQREENDKKRKAFYCTTKRHKPYHSGDPFRRKFGRKILWFRENK